MTSFGKLVLRDDKNTEEFSLSENTIVGYGAHCNIRLLTAAQTKPFTQAVIVSNGQRVHVTNLSDGSSGPTLLNGRMLKHNESIQLKNGDVLGFSFRQFLFEYVAPTSIPGQKPTARRETIAPSTQTMPLVVQRTLSKICNRRASVPEDQLTPPSATLPDSIFEDSLVEDSSDSPKRAEDESTGEAAIVATESSASDSYVLDQVVKTSGDTNQNNNEAESGDFPMEEACEPQGALPTQKDPAPVTEPATTEETCVLPKTFCELPATEEQPESSGFINGAASHDDNLEMVITTQTDIEMTSEPQNDSLVIEDSSKSPKTAEDKAAGETAVMATESSASVGSIQDQVVESSSDTNHNNSSDITMEVECEPQEALPKEEEPTSSATSNGTAKHDDTLELVITSQTDVEMACGSPKSPTDEAAIIELESSIAISSILGLVAKTSNDTNHKNEFGNEDIPMEETCEPQEVLPTHKDPTPVTEPATTEETCELPATEEQPESSGFINSTASHDDTSEMVITSQTDIEITSEPQNDSLVTEAVAAPSCLDEAETEDKAVESSLQETAEVIHGCPSVEMESVAGTNPNNSEEPCASTSESIQESDAAMVEHENSEEPGTSSSETDKNDNAASKKKDTNTASTIYVCDNQDPFIYYDKHFVMANTHLNPNDVPDFFEQVPKTPTKETKEDNGPVVYLKDQLKDISDEEELEGHPRSKFDSPPTLKHPIEGKVQSAGMSRPSRAAKTKVINQVAASKEKGKETTEPQITERAPETKQRGKRGAEPHVAEEIPKTKRRGRTCNESQIVEQSKGTKGKGKKTSEPQISEKGKNKPGTADGETKPSRKRRGPQVPSDLEEGEKRVTRSMSKKAKNE